MHHNNDNYTTDNKYLDNSKENGNTENSKNDEKLSNNTENSLLNPKYSNTPNIIFQVNIISDSYNPYNISNCFCVFSSVNNVSYCIYQSINKSVICFNLDTEQVNTIIKFKIQEDKEENEEVEEEEELEFINSFKYFIFDKKEFLLMVSAGSRSIKVLDFSNFNCLLNISKIYEEGYLNSACFLNNENNIYIITCNCQGFENIKIYNLEGEIVKEIKETNDNNYYIDVYYDSINKINYIITCNKDCLRAYNFNNNEIFNEYFDENSEGHFNFLIKKIGAITQLIESSYDGCIRIWNFHTGMMLKKIKNICDEGLNEICFLNDQYLFVGCNDDSIKLIDIDNGQIITCTKRHYTGVINVKKIYLEKYGECLISQAWKDSNIKLWLIYEKK